MTKRARPSPRTKKGSPDGPDEPFAVHEHIGRQLKSMFDDVVTQPIPEKLVKLLEELERKRRKD